MGKNLCEAAGVRAGERGQGALRPRLAHSAPRDQPRLRPRPVTGSRRSHRLGQSARLPAGNRGDGRRIRPALPAGAAPGLWQREDPRLRDDQDLGQHHARLLWRLLLLLHHRARRANHPEPLGRVDPQRNRRYPRQGARLYRRHLGSRRPHRQHVQAALQEPQGRADLPSRLLCLAHHLPAHGHRPQPDHQPLSQGARPQGDQEDPHRFRRALRYRGGRSPLYQGAGQVPRRRLPQDCAGAHRGGAALQDDEAGHGQLLPVQGAVRQILQRGGQAAVPDPLLHLRPPGHHRRRHGQSGALGQREPLQARSGAEFLPVAARQRHHHVLHGEKPVKQGEPHRWRCVCCQGRAPSPPAQGAAALPRPRRLADDPRSPARHGQGPPDWQWPGLSGASGRSQRAHRHWQGHDTGPDSPQ